MASNSEIDKLQRRWDENPLGLTFAPLAEAYRKAGDTARALELLEQGLAQHPNYVPAHIVRGRCHLDAQADQEAEISFLRVTELDPENVIALKGLAELSERAGRLPEALHRLELLLDVDRNNEEARGQLDRVRELQASQAAQGSPSSQPAATAAPAAEPAPTAAAEPIPQETLEAFEATALSDLQLDVDTELTSAPESEFQIPNDAETLRPADNRIADIVLGAEPPEPQYHHAEVPPGSDAGSQSDSLLDAGTDSVDALLGDDYSSLLSYQHEPAETVESVETIESAVHKPVADEEGKVPGFIPVGDELGIPFGDLLPPPPAPPFERETFLPPPPAPEPEFQPAEAIDAEAAIEESAPEPEPPVAPEPEPSAAEDAEPELVVTETMAEIFLRQGHRELALAVYVQLAQREPDNERIAAALARLTPDVPPPPPAPAPEPPRPFAASDTGGRSVGQLFGALLSAARPTPAPAIHPPAFEPPKRGNGEPTRPAQESLSLSAVFGEGGTPVGPAGTNTDPPAGEPSFDEFFAPATGSAEVELPRAPGSETNAMPAPVPEDLEQFNAWLRGLKR